jgi:integrase
MKNQFEKDEGLAQWIGKPTEEWLKSYSKKAVIGIEKRNIAYYCKWMQKTDATLVQEYKDAVDKDEWSKKTGEKLIEWLNVLKADGYSVNTVRAYVASVRAFFTNQCRAVKIQRGKVPKQQMATGEHEFSVLELRKMFHYADTRGKAILSTAVSLGWAADDFLNLTREEIEMYVTKALADGLQFIGFMHVRGKTGAPNRSHLTPEAIESLKAYLDISSKDAKFLWTNGSLEDHLTGDTINNILRDLTAKAGIVTIGTVHFHLIRKFTMSALSSAGIGDWDVKFMVGKEVPPDIATYLTNRKEVLMEEFQKAYPKLSLTGYANRNHDKVSELEEENRKLKENNALIWATLAQIVGNNPKMAEIRKVIERELKAPTAKPEREE